jgi:thiol-disulfide isomerase/thioredoxin
MRKLGILAALIVVLSSCETEHSKQYLTFSGKIENSKDSILIIVGEGMSKTIKIAEDGSFKDTLKVKESKLYTLSSQNSGRGIVFLKNGYSLELTGDATDFFNSFIYQGNDEGADSNNFIVKRFSFGKTAGNIKGFIALEKEDFLNKVTHFKNGMDSISQLYSNVNSDMLKESNDQNSNFFKKLLDNYDTMHANMLQQNIAEEKLKRGNLAPEFLNYENDAGGTSSLKDFKGNYVYIDVWATWCRPCIAQIPYLKKLEEEYKNKNITFVSISTDDDRRSSGSWEKAHDKWKNMVKQKNLTGTQLWAGKDNTRFSQEYMIRGIPRFILIDPKGNIVDSDAKRPTDPSIRTLLNELPGI